MVWRPDTCARLDRLAPKVNSLQGGDIYRINDPIKTAQVWQLPAISKYVSPSHANEPAKGDVDGRLRTRSNKMRGSAMSFAGCPDSAYGDLSKDGWRRPGYTIKLMSLSLSGPNHILRQSSKFARKRVKSI